MKGEDSSEAQIVIIVTTAYPITCFLLKGYLVVGSTASPLGTLKAPVESRLLR